MFRIAVMLFVLVAPLGLVLLEHLWLSRRRPSARRESPLSIACVIRSGKRGW